LCLALLCPSCLRGSGRGAGVELFDQIVCQVVRAVGIKNNRRHVGALAGDIQHQCITAGFGVRFQNGADFFDDLVAALAFLFAELGAADIVVFLDVLFGGLDFG